MLKTDKLHFKILHLMILLELDSKMMKKNYVLISLEPILYLLEACLVRTVTQNVTLFAIKSSVTGCTKVLLFIYLVISLVILFMILLIFKKN
jgi:hypothetical protein